MAKAKLKMMLFAATFAFGVSSLGTLAADDMPPPPPPGGDMSAPPPPGGDMAAPPPPGGDMAAPPPPGGDMAAPPPPAGGPAGDALAPPPTGDMTAPPPGGDLAPPPGGGELAPPPSDTQYKEEPKSKGGSGKLVNNYSVSSGDSLWRISGKRKIYGDSYQWPMIFIANRDRIKDPDIIKPGWDLSIRRGVAADEVATAVRKAKDTPRFHPHTTERKKLPIEY